MTCRQKCLLKFGEKFAIVQMGRVFRFFSLLTCASFLAFPMWFVFVLPFFTYVLEPVWGLFEIVASPKMALRRWLDFPRFFLTSYIKFIRILMLYGF